MHQHSAIVAIRKLRSVSVTWSHHVESYRPHPILVPVRGFLPRSEMERKRQNEGGMREREKGVLRQLS